jgi:hypothetical protein
MSYVVRSPDGRPIQETNELLDALDTMRACGRGATVVTDEGVLLATNVGPFSMRVGRDEVGTGYTRAFPSYATAMPRAAGVA